MEKANQVDIGILDNRFDNRLDIENEFVQRVSSIIHTKAKLSENRTIPSHLFPCTACIYWCLDIIEYRYYIYSTLYVRHICSMESGWP